MGDLYPPSSGIPDYIRGSAERLSRTTVPDRDDGINSINHGGARLEEGFVARLRIVKLNSSVDNGKKFYKLINIILRKERRFYFMEGQEDSPTNEPV